MNREKRIASSLAFAAAFALAIPATAVHAESFTIDPAHSFVQFKISHLGYSVLNGRFNDLAGEFEYDPANPADAKISVTVQTASVDTNHAERDKHLRSSDFLEVDKYPEARFVSTSFSEQGESGILTGDLTLHGVTRPISIEMSHVGAGPDPWGGYRRGFEGSTVIRRADFDMSYNLGPASEEMTLELFVEGIRK